MTAVVVDAREVTVEAPLSGFRLSGSTLIGGLIVLLFAVMGFLPDVFSTQSTTALDVGNQLLGPSSHHLFGTDEVGRDIFSRVVHGARYSLSMALAIVLIA